MLSLMETTSQSRHLKMPSSAVLFTCLAFLTCGSCYSEKQPAETGAHPNTDHTVQSTGPDSILYSFPATAVSIKSDHLNNIYLVTPENTIEKRAEQGKLLATFNDKRFGQPAVDATDPMKIVAYYSDFDIVVILDNTLSPTRTVYLSDQQGIRNASLVAHAYGNALWLYDQDDFKLKRLEENGAVSLISDDLSLQDIVTDPIMIIERDNRIYLCDSSQGIHVFDTYLNYEKTISAQSVTYVEKIDNALFYQTPLALSALDLATLELSTIHMPSERVSLQRSRRFMLFPSRVEVAGTL